MLEVRCDWLLLVLLAGATATGPRYSRYSGATGATGPQGIQAYSGCYWCNRASGPQGNNRATGPCSWYIFVVWLFWCKTNYLSKHINIPAFGSPSINNVEGVTMPITGPVAVEAGLIQI